MKLGSLFDGSGGFPLAGILCGIEPVWAAEVEPYPIAVTRSRFPETKHLGNVSLINGAEIEPVDIVTFGSPCQDLSVAGKRAGLKHEANGDEETTRSGLFMEAVRIIKEMREATNGEYPTFALWENVPGAFSSNKGEDFRTVLEELIKIVEPEAVMPAVPKNGWPYADSYCGDGWSLAYRVFDAQYWGVPQRRRRIHLVLDLRGERARKVLFECEGLRGYFAEGRTPWQSLATDAQDCTGADDREGNGVAYGFPLGFRPENVRVYEEVGTTLCNGTRPGFTTGVVVARPEEDDREGAVAYTLRIRSGCEGGGKGALIQENKSATLATNNDRYLFQPIPNLLLDDQGGQQINVRMDDKAPTMRAEAHGNVPAVVCYDARGNGDGEVANTITGDHENRITDYTSVVCEPIPIHDQATRFSGKRGEKQDGKGNGMGVGAPGDPMNTLTSTDRHGVAYINTYQKVTGPLMANSHPGSYCGQDAYTDMLVVGKEDIPEVQYIVRRLTPTECARLQGFPDRWGHIDHKDDFTDEEYAFWTEARCTHAAINGKEPKTYSKEQMLAWYNKLHTDSAEYKMWGNGIALPPALYVMQGMAEAIEPGGEDGRIH